MIELKQKHGCTKGLSTQTKKEKRAGMKSLFLFCTRVPGLFVLQLGCYKMRVVCCCEGMTS